MKSIEIICVLDRSQSMAQVHGASLESFNSYVQTQVNKGVKAKVTLAVFNDKYEVIRDRVKIKDMTPVSEEEVPAIGTTALHDAIGNSILNAKSGKPTIMMIMTDGHENASRTFSGSKVRGMIDECHDSGWAFEFYGAGIDSVAAGGDLGFKGQSYKNIDKSLKGMYSRGIDMSESTASYFSLVNNALENAD